jgi:hypothetical protein
MKYAFVVFVFIGTLSIIGCDRPVCDCPGFPNGDTVIVGMKEKANVYNCCDDRFAIIFNGVKEDSRCPDGLNCFNNYMLVAGTAKVNVNINGIQHLELQLNKPGVINSGGYSYTLLLTDLTPHPKSGLPTDPNTYKAMIVVNRN